MTDNGYPDGVLEITVRIDRAPDGNYIWYYNSISAGGLNIGAGSNIGRIVFRFDARTAERYAFDPPDITSYSPYEDLTKYPPEVADDCIIVFDDQTNRDYVTVGGITLNAHDKNANCDANGNLKLSSDPEITNTGSET